MQGIVGLTMGGTACWYTCCIIMWHKCSFPFSSLSLIVNLVESRSTKTEAAVFISFEKTPFDAYSFPGITGMVKRLQKAKELLDQQWGIDTVYQEDYSALLYAADTGRRITSNPAVLADLIQEFSTYHKQAINEVLQLFFVMWIII